MELRDLIVTPILLMIIYTLAYVIRPYVTDQITRRYFFPALTVRILGALAVGFLYQFYYGGGDTFNFHTHGSRHIWEAFWDSPDKGLKLMFGDRYDVIGVYEYASNIPFYNDKSSFAIVKIASVFDLLTFSSYSATSICFSLLSFAGAWMLFLTFYTVRPGRAKLIALCTLFIPSVFFWGGGLLKDTITLAALGICAFYIKRIFLDGRPSVYALIVVGMALTVIFIVKKYILICFLPAALIWIFLQKMQHVREGIVKVLLFPFVLAIIVIAGVFAVQQIGKDDPRYALGNLAETARITAYDIAFQTGRDAGSTYSLGELDGSFGNLLSLAPKAINVALFRPYLWEVRNPLMLMSALESVALLFATIFVVYSARSAILLTLSKPEIVFVLVFSLTFAFAVGVSTFNFGTLSRYKIPMMPFFAMGLVFLFDEALKIRSHRAASKQ